MIWKKLKLEEVADLQWEESLKPPPHSPEVEWYMERYPEWRAAFDGTALEEVIENTPPGSEPVLRWPVRLNLIRSYCLAYASLLWGKGRTGAESNELFRLRCRDTAPIKPGPQNIEGAARVEELLNYWWGYFFHTVRQASAIQQWAGGCALKVAWEPFSPQSVLGCQLQLIQPEHFFPLWNPLNFEELLAVQIRILIPLEQALLTFQLDLDQMKEDGWQEGDLIQVREVWDQRNYGVYLRFSPRGPERPAMAGDMVLVGPNPFISPLTRRGIIPFVYVPRLRTGNFFGDSLAYNLLGLQEELNKTLADFGDALTRSSHPAFGLSDVHSMSSTKGGVIAIPRSGALNLGITPPNRTPPRVHEFPQPEVPAQTEQFSTRLLDLSQMISALSPGALGAETASAGSGLALAMRMMPTINAIEWMRSHWAQAIAGRGGINHILLTIWRTKADLLQLPAIAESAFQFQQEVEFKPILPRDRVEIIDEVVRLATAKAISPREWLKRLGEIEDIDAELEELLDWMKTIAAIEASVAGRAVQTERPTNPPNPKAAPAPVAGTERRSRQPAQQPEGLEENG